MTARGRGRGALALRDQPGANGNSGSAASPALMEARVTEILDVATFWAQIGTVVSLAQFDKMMASLAMWCEEQGAGMKALPKVKEVVAVRNRESGTWLRGKVSRQISDSEIEVFFIDVGATTRVKLTDVCTATTPLLYSSPAQALQCTLLGVEPPGGEEGWSEEALGRLTELVRGTLAVRFLVHNIDGFCCAISAYVRHEEEWMSVGQILARENLAKYTPVSPSTFPVLPWNNHTKVEQPKAVRDEQFESASKQESPLAAGTAGVGEKEIELEDGEASTLQTGRNGCSPKTPPLEELEAVPALIECGGREEGEGVEGGVEDERDSRENASEAASDNKSTGFGWQPSPKPTSGRDDDRTPTNATVAVEEPGLKEQAKGRESQSEPSQLSSEDAAQGKEGETESSDDEWDESLLPPRQYVYSGSSETSLDSPYKNDPFADSELEPQAQQRRAKLQAQYDSLMSNTGRWGGGGGGGGGGGSSYQHQQPPRWRQFHRRQGNHDYQHQGHEGSGQGRFQRRGERYRGGGRGHSRSDFEHGDGGREREGESRPGGMRGVHVNRPPRDYGERGGSRGMRERLPPRLQNLYNKGGFTRQQQQEAHDLPSPSTQPPSTKSTDPPPPSSPPPPVTTQQPVALFKSVVITGMTESEAKNEMEWHSWRLKQKVRKFLESVSMPSASSCGGEVQNLLTDPSAQKLSSLPSSRGPLWTVLECVVLEAVGKPSEAAKMTKIITSIHSVMGSDVRQLLQPVLEEIAQDVCQGSAATDAQKNRHAFCSFLGKLFIDASYSRSEEYSSTVGHSIRHYLNSWSQCAPEQNELQSLAHADCFAALCEEIGPTIDITNKETLDSYFDGAIKEHILAGELPRSVRERLLEVTLLRSSVWGQARASKVLPRRQQLTLQPLVQNFSQEAPAGGKVVHPTPVTMERNGTMTLQLGRMGMRQQREVLPTSIPPQQQLQQAQYQQVQVAQSPSAFVSPPQPQYHHPQSHHISPPAGAPMQIISPPPHLYTHPYPHPHPHPLLVAVQEVSNPYSQVEEILNCLGFPELMEKFKNAMITDSLLEYEREELKGCLKDAGVPAGPILRITDYLDKSKERRRSSSGGASLSRHSSSSSQPSTPIQPHPSHTPLSPLQQTFQPSVIPGPPLHGFMQMNTGVSAYGNGGAAVSSQASSLQGQGVQQPQYYYQTGVPSSQSAISVRLPGERPDSSAPSKPPERQGGFGSISCVLCGSQTHKTEMCSQRSSLFFY